MMIAHQTGRHRKTHLLILFSLLALHPAFASAQSIEGVWRQVERETRGGPNAGLVSGAQMQPWILFYTDGYYASVRVLATEPRAPLGANPTAAELLAAWEPVAAHAGTYEMDGSTITYHAIVDKDPNAMLPENATYVRKIGSLTASTLETSATDAAGVTTILRYRRVE